MALSWGISALFLVLALASIEFSTSTHVVKGSVSCLDCKHEDDLADVKVLVKCEKVKQFTATTTAKDGSFEAQLTTDPSSTPCKAQLLGGPQQLCSYKKSMVSKIVKARNTNSYTISTPLAFSTSCPLKAKRANSMYGSSKTVDLPIPAEWGLPPTSYYVPVYPIGIP